MTHALEDRDLTVSGMIRYWAERTPDACATEFAGHRLTYADIDAEADRIAASLHGLGLVEGDRVLWLGKNSDGFARLVVGVARARMVIVPVNWRLSAPEVRFIAQDCGAALAVIGAPFVEACKAALDGVAHVLPADAAPGRVSPGWVVDLPADRSFDDGTGDEMATLIYTSGTTGVPKGVILSNHNLLAANQARRGLAWDSWSPDDVCLITMPFGHIGGYAVLLRTWFNGARGVILPEFEPEAVLSAIGDHGITKIALVPAMIQRLLASPTVRTTDYASIDLIFYGTSPIAPGLLREATEIFGCGFAQGYGASETGGGIVALTPDDHRVPDGRLLAAAGKPLPGVELRIVDSDDGAPLPVDTVGEIAVRSACVMQGYWCRPEQQPIDADGWYRTGDAGSIDADGYLWIRGRVKDMIVSGGENIYPVEVENAMFGHDDIADVAVIGIPDDRWGEAVAAFVVAVPGRQIDVPALIDWTKQRIARYKAPRHVFPVDALPRNATGKVLKGELRRPFWEGRDRQVG